MHRGPALVITKPLKIWTLLDVGVRCFIFCFCFFGAARSLVFLLETQCFFRHIFRVCKTVLGFITFPEGFLVGPNAVHS